MLNTLRVLFFFFFSSSRLVSIITFQTLLPPPSPSTDWISAYLSSPLRASLVCTICNTHFFPGSIHHREAYVMTIFPHSKLWTKIILHVEDIRRRSSTDNLATRASHKKSVTKLIAVFLFTILTIIFHSSNRPLIATRPTFTSLSSSPPRTKL